MIREYVIACIPAARLIYVFLLDMRAHLVRPRYLFVTSLNLTGDETAPTPAAQPMEHQILVGANGQLAFAPPNITASIGDTVKFFFNPKNHSGQQGYLFVNIPSTYKYAYHSHPI
jgi:hypothetical protein